ncbi:isocitrate lyase/phosphoenolpyruvate mutase family protein [Kribbella sp. VKM Ac-2566]|uniref:isocitrate lyase/PEP mutase family protein n=1 Tax=Kribbella sp. VKM Ac-2566 TaxID=2512218 RepID=UPI00106270F2|nr:isocitrate lyase/phosphoenolpyruvate mutase family protein [Kribbella sp. VKM Ac-2566]TDX08256.1 2-methylisocitrate lyase-like PEP mutase family enzyme [Kribbella sp. VKM Ac-2566]
MTFSGLHYADVPLLLPNAWDIPSALAFLEAGFEAIGTTSFGVASSLGQPDAARLTRDANLWLARALTVLPVFINVDIEDGYSDDPQQIADYVAELDVAGINIEDSTSGQLVSPDLCAAKVAAIKRACPDLFVNARVDTYWLGQEATVGGTLRRAARYVDSGADGVFVPGATEPAELSQLAAQIGVPMNVLAIPSMSLSDFADLGIRRVSTGSLPYRAAIHSAAQVAAAVREGDKFPSAVSYPEMQARLLSYQRQMAQIERN